MKKNQTITLTNVAAEMLNLSPAGSKTESQVITWLSSWSSRSRELWLSVTTLCPAPPVLNGVTGRAWDGSNWLRLLAACWLAKATASKASGWIPTLRSGSLQSLYWLFDVSQQWILAGQASEWFLTLRLGSLQSLDWICEVSWQWNLACYQLNLGQRSEEKSTLLWPTWEIWPTNCILIL